MTTLVRIPKAKIGVLIGPDGATKKQIEINTETKLHIDSAEGLVTIERAGDPVGELKAADIVKAIGRGFPMLKALRISEDDCILDIVNLKDYKKQQKDIERIRGRIIGEAGKSKKRIEQMTETDISIYGKTVCIIGTMEWVQVAKQAVDRLARGQEHSTVFKFIERARRSLISKGGI